MSDQFESWLLDSFDAALERRDIQPWYQPVIRTLSGKMCSMEALARWVDPERGTIRPDQFIPVLEKHQLIHRLDEQAARIENLFLRLAGTAEKQILIRRHRIELLEQRLAACNPERIYRMGYSLLTRNGKIVRSIADIQPGDIVTSHLSDGSIDLTPIHG